MTRYRCACGERIENPTKEFMLAHGAYFVDGDHYTGTPHQLLEVGE